MDPILKEFLRRYLEIISLMDNSCEYALILARQQKSNSIHMTFFHPHNPTVL
jgi:hypothetical protein